MRTPGAASASAMSCSSAVMRLTRTPAGRSTLKSVTVGPATQPTTSAMMAKLSSVSWRQAAVSVSSASVALSFLADVLVARMSKGGSSKPSAGRGVASGVAEEDGALGEEAFFSASAAARARPSLRVRGCSTASGASKGARRPPMTCVSSEDEGCFGLPFASSPAAAPSPRRPFLARGSTLVGAAPSPAVSGTKPPASPAFFTRA